MRLRSRFQIRGDWTLRDSSTSRDSRGDMAAVKSERFLSSLQISDPLGGFAPPHSPLDSYQKLEELHLLLQSAAAGNSFLTASTDGLGFLTGESGDGDRPCGGKAIFRVC